MQIRQMTDADIPKWRALSAEYDRYVQESTPDLSEWYQGNRDSPAFDVYMRAKIHQKEAFMTENEACLGAIAFSITNNRITFFAVAHTADFQSVAKALMYCALEQLNGALPIQINCIISTSAWIRQQHALYADFGFNLCGQVIENGVCVNAYVKLPSA